MELIEEQKILYTLTHTQYAFLSNFYESPFQVEGGKYLTNEHFFQSKKFQGLPHEKTIVNCKTPFEAFEEGRTRKFPYRTGWRNLKDTIMLQGLKFKFDQNLQMKEQLLGTRDKMIIERDDFDYYWSDGKDGSGKNRMGFMLMKLRLVYR